MSDVFISIDLRDSTRTKWKMQKSEGTQEEKGAATEQLVWNMWNQYARLAHLFVVAGFDLEHMYMIKSLGDEFWLHLNTKASPQQADRMFVALESLDPVDWTGSGLLQRVMAGRALDWKVTIDVVEGAIDCGQLAFEVVSQALPQRPHGRATTGSPFEQLSREEQIRALQRLTAGVHAGGGQDGERFVVRYDPVGWQVDRFHRLKNVCREGHGRELVVGGQFMERFFPNASDDDSPLLATNRDGAEHAYARVAMSEVFKGFDEEYRYHFVSRERA